MSDGENDDSKAPRGMTVRDVYKAEVLGEGCLFKDGDIDTFSNENFLRYRY
jgi:hypothetical protein